MYAECNIVLANPSVCLSLHYTRLLYLNEHTHITKLFSPLVWHDTSSLSATADIKFQWKLPQRE